MMDFTFSSFAASLIYSTIRIWLFREGRKRTNQYWIGLGVILIVYTYFTHGPLQDWGAGAALCGLAYWKRYDY